MQGMGRKATLTKKCTCNKPNWVNDDIEVSRTTSEITYILNCKNCGAHWGTKANEARKYWADKMDSIPVVWMGYVYKGDKTTRELFRGLDLERLKLLTDIKEEAEEKVLEAQKAASKAAKAIEKCEKQMNEWNILD